MEKQFPYYSPNNLDFKIFGYKCIITKKLIVDKETIKKENVKMNIFKCKGLFYFVFCANNMISDN